jgi:hypothetical protein
MASIYRDIRAALETKLKAVSGLPSISYENSSYDRKNGTSYLETSFLPTLRRPAVRGLSPQQRYQGVFRVVCYAPEGTGPGAADELADKVLNAFEATTDASYLNNSGENIIVSIDYAEREGGGLDTPFYYVPVNIGFYIYN